MNFDFGEVLTKAWQIIWKHKILWVFGILAGCGTNRTNFNYQMNQGDLNRSMDLPPQAYRMFETIQDNLTAIIVVIITLTCIFSIIILFLNAIGRIGLIRGTAQADGGAERLVLGELFSGSVPYFWRIFGLSLILLIPTLLFVIIMIVTMFGAMASMFSGDESGMFGVLAMVPILFGCMCLLVPVMFVVGMVFRQAENAIVLEDLGVLPALSRGWEVFKNNLGSILILTIILLVISFIVGVIIAIPFFIISFPAMLAFIASGARSSAPFVFMTVCMCLFLPVGLLLRGIITSYAQSTWTLTYLRLTHTHGGDDTTLPDPNPPAEPQDSDKTLLAPRPNA